MHAFHKLGLLLDITSSGRHHQYMVFVLTLEVPETKKAEFGNNVDLDEVVLVFEFSI